MRKNGTFTGKEIAKIREGERWEINDVSCSEKQKGRALFQKPTEKCTYDI